MSIVMPGAVSDAARLYSAAAVKEPPQVQRAETGSPVRRRMPAVDEYVPEEKQEPSGRYWLGRDEDGQPKVYFDGPGRTADRPSDTPSPAARSTGGKAERCTGSTDQVDREIQRLRKRKETLERQISSQTDDGKIKELERKLAQAERELAQKDNDAYRRQHTVFS